MQILASVSHELQALVIAKKIKEKFYYFGPWTDPQTALANYHVWLAGEKPKEIIPENGLPRKPTPDYPLFAHSNGQWAKKVRGRFHYFGPWSDPQAALEKWVAQKDALLAD